MSLIEGSGHKNTEEGLRKSKEKYHALLTNMLEGFAYCQILVDENNEPVDFVYLEVNDAFERLTGLRKEDVLGRKVTEVIPGTKELHPELFSIYGKVALTGKRTKFDIYFKPLEIWLSISAYSPQKGYFIAVFENFTERKQTEARIEKWKEFTSSLLSGSTDGFAVVDQTGKQILISDGLCKVTGYGKEELLDQKPPFKYWAEDRLEDIKDSFEKTLAGVDGEYTLIFKRKNGERFIALVKPRKIVDADGNAFFFATIKDITEVGQARKGQEATSPATSEGNRTLPEERVIRASLDSLSDREIIILILGLRLPPSECEKLANKCLERFKNLRGFLSASPRELEREGIPAQCISCIKLVHEIPSLVLKEKIIDKPVYKSSKEVFNYLLYSMQDLNKEVFKVIYLNNRNQIIDTVDLFEGGQDSISIHLQELVGSALSRKATGLIFAHNHPAGDSTPSKSDKQLTRDLVFMGMILQIAVLDHIIIGGDTYFSFSDEGLIKNYEDDFLNLRIKSMLSSQANLYKPRPMLHIATNKKHL